MEKEVKYETHKTFLVKFAYYAVWAALIYFVIKLLGSVLLPFFLALLLAWALKYPVDFLSGKSKINRKLCALFVVLLFFALICGSCYLLGKSICGMLGTAWGSVSGFLTGTLIPVLDSFTNWCETLGGTGDAGPFINARELISEVSCSMVSTVSGAAACIPGICMNLLVIVIETIFMEMEYPSIVCFVRKWMPEKWQKLAVNGKRSAGVILGKYAASYALLFVMTFVELLIGFLILKVKRAFAAALFIAVLDILPILGTGTILLPWGLFLVICGNKDLGIGILILYVFITIVRNFAEPRLVGKQMGVSPAVTLPCIMVGYQLFGLAGVFLLPVGAAVFQYFGGIEAFAFPKGEKREENK